MDPGFSRTVLLEMVQQLERYSNEDLAALGADADELRSFFESWQKSLAT